MRKIICYIATSADGYIARPDGDIEWLNRRPSPKGHYGYAAFHKSVDTVIWGRKTFDLVREWGRDLTQDFGPMTHYVFSKSAFSSPLSAIGSGGPDDGKRSAESRKPKAESRVHFVSGDDIPGFLRNIRAQKGKNIWMMGGGGVIGSFMEVGGIDEFIVHVIPTFLGEGIPLIAPRHLDVSLRVRSTRTYPDGVVRLHYDVARDANRPKRASSRTGAKAAGQRTSS